MTEGEIVLDRHVDVTGTEDDSVLRFVYINSFFQAGIKSPMDDAVLKHERPKIGEYEKVDEIPFDLIESAYPWWYATGKSSSWLRKARPRMSSPFVNR